MSIVKEQSSKTTLNDLIENLGSRLTSFGPRSSEETKTLSAMFDLKLPLEYVWFLQHYGALVAGDVQILGMAGAERADLAVDNMTLMLRLGFAQMPLDLLPIEDLGSGRYACLVCPERRSEPTPVLLLNLSDSDDSSGPTPLAQSFLEYVYSRLVLLLEPASIEDNNVELKHGLAVLESHIQRYNEMFHYEHKTGGRLPANHDWRPYRYCIQDVLFGTVVVQHDRKYNRLKVDVFLTAEVSEYDPLAPAQALAAFLLSEAYKCGGSMEIQFTREVQGGQVPRQLQDLAASFGLNFENAEHGLITAQEAKSLYTALTGFTAGFKERLNNMEAEGLIKMVRACYVVHHGVWTREQVEMIVLGSEYPDRILSGVTHPNERHLYQHDLFHARAAVMCGMLDRSLNLRNRPESTGSEVELEDDFRPIKFGFDGINYVREVFCEEDLPLPWLVGKDSEHHIPAGVKFEVLIRARDGIDLKRHFADDLKQASKRHSQTNLPTFLLIPAELNETEVKDLLIKCLTAGIGLLVCPETTINLDTEAAQKLSQSGVLRQ
jgi:hypothetical protein